MHAVARFFAGVAAAAALLASPPAAAAVTLLPAGHAFGVREISAGPTSAFNFSVQNAGGAFVVLGQVVISGTDAADFVLGADTCSAALLNPGDMCSVDVSFDPSTGGAKTASLDITSGAGSPSSSLTGTGVVDTDMDTIPDATDNCPTVANVGQQNADLDAYGDACDPFPNTPNSLPGVPTAVVGTPGGGEVSVAFTPGSTGGATVTYTATSNPDGLTGTGSSSPVVVTGLTNGTPYTFTVTATNFVGTSAPSDPSAPVTPTGVPGKPLNVTAVGGIGSAQVSFDPPASDNGSPINSYLVTSTPDGITANGAGSPITVTGLANATSYTFVVSATNGVGQGPDSDPSAPVLTAAVAPGGAMRVLARAGNGQALVDVVDTDDGGSAITGYQVTSNPGGIIASGATLPITVNGLTNGVTYVFTATVTNAIGTTPVAAPSHTIRPFSPSAPLSPLVYVPSLYDNDVYVIDTRDNTVVTRVLVGGAPTGTTVNPVLNRVYVANADDDTVSVIDTTTMQVIATVPVEIGPNGIAVNPAGTKVYVSNSGSDSVSVIDAATNAVTTTIAGVTAPRGLVVSPDGTSVFVASGLRLRKIDTATDTVVTTGAIFGTPAGIEITPDGSTLFVTNVASLKVNRIPTSTLNSLANTNPDTGAGHGIAVGSNGTVYAARTSEGKLAIIDGTTLALTTLPVGDTPRGVALTPNGQHLYVTNENSDDMSVVRTSDNTVVATIPLGFGPGALGRFIGPAAPPREPQTVTAVRGNAQATVSFGAPGYDGGLPVTSYTVTSLPGGNTATGTGSPIVVNGLANGTPYTFTVTASNAKGPGPASAPSNTVTPATLPSAPQNLSALGPDGEADISFGAPASTGGSPITGYTLTCLPGPITISAGTALVIAATGLANGQQYTCTVAASNAVGTGPASAPVSVTPNAANYTITVIRAGNGSGTVTSTPGGIGCGPTCSASFATSSSVALTATPAAGSAFAGWSGACTGTGACNITVDAARSVTATFTLIGKQSLTVTAQGSGSGTVTSAPAGLACFATCSASFLQGSSVALTPAAASGSTFKGWGGACTGTGACNVTLDAAKNVTATFDRDNPPRLVNLSTRMQVLTGNDRMIAGFIVGGAVDKTVVVSVAGPSLTPFGLNGLADPTLTLVRSSDQSVVASNDDWQAQATPANVAAIQATGFQPNDTKEPAIIATLPPGAYTAIVEGVGGVTGTGLVGVFEVDRLDVPLINISTRGRVLTGNDVMIAGFIVQGDEPQTVVINVAGPTLNAFGLDGLANPTLTLVRSSDQTVIAANDDWQTQANANDVFAIQATGFQPNNPAEPAIIATLQPGAYTAIVQGVGGGTGVGLVGVFRDDQDATIRSGVIELINAAEVCKNSVAEYYQANGVFPADSASSGCSNLGTANTSPPAVAAGLITVGAAGALATRLVGQGSGTNLTYSPVLAGSAIQSWNCKFATTIRAEYLPPACR